MARPEELPEATVVKWGSLCTADCEGRYHVPQFETCERCGAQIHRRVIEVADPQRGLVKVGSECIQDIMGWKWSKSHEEALLIQDIFDLRLVEQGTWVTEIRRAGPRRLINEHLADTLRIGRPSVGLSSAIEVPGWIPRLWRAAYDLGLPWIPEDDLIAVRTADLSPDTYNWTAAVPGLAARGGQASESYQAQVAMGHALRELGESDARREYSPVGGIWKGAYTLASLARWSRFDGVQAVDPRRGFGW